MLKQICTLCLLIFLLTLKSVATAAPPQKIVLLGDSLGASYGVAPEQGWANLLNARLETQNSPFRLINASISGDTTAGGLARLEALLQQEQPTWVLIELGGNDGLRGLDLNAMKQNLTAMIALARQYHAQTALVGIKIPPNYGRKYRERFEHIYAELSQEQQIPLLPFLLEGVGGVEQLMQEDRIHPNAEAQPIIVDNVWRFLQPLLRGAETTTQQQK